MISDACIKRKIRDYVEKVHSGESGYRIYLKSGTVIADTNKEAFTTLGKKLDKKADETVTDWLCENFLICAHSAASQLPATPIPAV